MKLEPRIIDTLEELRRSRYSDLVNIFSTIAFRKKNIRVHIASVRGDLIFGISDVTDPGQNFRDWRFQTISQDINASYYEIWNNHGRDEYFLYRSYFHLYILVEQQFVEKEYILLHCDAAEPDDVPHSTYKQSPHLHVEVADQPIPKAHLALYNGRVKEVLTNRASFDTALLESVNMLNSQILQAHTLL